MAACLFRCSAAALLACGIALASNAPSKVVTPVVAKTTMYGNLIDPGLNRDSCTSALWYNNVLWVCRDTQQVLKNGSIGHNIVANTASFSGFPTNPSRPDQLTLLSPQGFGPLFYAFQEDECLPGSCGDNVCGPGVCADGTRWVGWPDTTPLVVRRGPLNGWVDAYGFMARQHLTGLTVLNSTGNDLFHVISRVAGEEVIPNTAMTIANFWSATEIGYGTACHVIVDGYAYLWGGTPDAKLALARVDLSSGTLDYRPSYEFYVNGKWTRTTPLNTDPTIALPNTSSKQGTIYYSPKWESFVWIGGDSFPNANAYISTAPKAEGPWTAAQEFYSGTVGNGTLPAYSALAHPSLTDGTGDYIFITWTKTYPDPATGFDVYEQPLVRVDWK
ncbi:hypothetical protein MSAN_00960600 [Mycena sanguinolenta]|uniref:DUF4185 domain-containing protein n=1 Tax=Mycena sanguinolenta TaxID=230812 RepID=A0A8H7DA79_9AGAR|nr:hypothetical protein MSAN_00960600 [Mycena sanguinolenta]